MEIDQDLLKMKVLRSPDNTKAWNSPYRDEIIEMIKGGWSARAISAWLKEKGENISAASMAKFIKHYVPKDAVINFRLLIRMKTGNENIIPNVIQEKFKMLKVLEDKLYNLMALETQMKMPHLSQTMEVYDRWNSLANELIAIMRQEGYYESVQQSAPGDISIHFNNQKAQLFQILKDHPDLAERLGRDVL